MVLKNSINAISKNLIDTRIIVIFFMLLIVTIPLFFILQR